MIATAVGLSLALIAPTAASADDGEMSIARAGNYYLKVICKGNAAMDKYDAVVFGKKGVVKYKQYKGKRLKKSRKAARVASKANYRSASKLQHPQADWPSDIASRVSKLVDNYLDSSDQLDRVATKGRRKSFDAVGAVSDLSVTGSKISKRIRAYLDLPPLGEGCK